MSLPAHLTDSVYEQLRRVAARQLRREGRSSSLQPTAMVHEAFVRIGSGSDVDWASRTHFVAVAASQVRRVLIQHARRRKALKRGGEWRRMSLQTAHLIDEPGIDVLRLHETLERLEEEAPEFGRVVELRFFGGLDEREVAEALAVSERTVRRRWVAARAWLHRELGAGKHD